MTDTFNLVVWYGESYDYEMRDVSAESAVQGAHRVTNSVGAKTGIITKVIITDSGDFTNFEWRYGEGVVFPTKEQLAEGG